MNRFGPAAFSLLSAALLCETAVAAAELPRVVVLSSPSTEPTTEELVELPIRFLAVLIEPRDEG